MTKAKSTTGGFQMHEHSVLNSRFSPTPKIVHSHDGGEQPHQHPDCGPAFYGYPRQTPNFSAKPKGEQRPWLDLEDWQRSFEIIICDPSPAKGQPGYLGEGPGLLPVERMVTGFKMRISRIVDGRTTAALVLLSVLCSARPIAAQSPGCVSLTSTASPLVVSLGCLPDPHGGGQTWNCLALATRNGVDVSSSVERVDWIFNDGWRYLTQSLTHTHTYDYRNEYTVFVGVRIGLEYVAAVVNVGGPMPLLPDGAGLGDGVILGSRR